MRLRLAAIAAIAPLAACTSVAEAVRGPELAPVGYPAQLVPRNQEVMMVSAREPGPSPAGPNSLWRSGARAWRPMRNAESLKSVTWEEVKAEYTRLAERPLDRSTATEWLADWSAFESALTEAASLAMVAYTCDTEDKEKQERYLKFSGDILPRAEELSVALAKRLVALGWAPPGMELPVRRFRAQIEIFREAEADPLRALVFAAVIGVIVGEARWVLYFIPLEGFLAGVFILLVFYLASGVISNYLQDRLNTVVLLEFCAVTAAGLAIVIGGRVLT